MEVLREIDFQDKKVKIYENTVWFSTTTDSVLLSNFASFQSKDKKILDLGTGVGTIPLLLSFKTKAKIYGIELQEDVYQLSKKSIKENNLEHQIFLTHGNIKEASSIFGKNTFDVVLSNPPYFLYKEEKVTNLDIHRKYARHEVAITLAELVKSAKEVLKDHGRFILIYRTERLLDVFEVLKKEGFEPKKIQFVYHDHESISKLFLIESTKYGKRELKILAPYYIKGRKEVEENAKKL